MPVGTGHLITIITVMIIMIMTMIVMIKIKCCLVFLIKQVSNTTLFNTIRSLYLLFQIST